MSKSKHSAENNFALPHVQQVELDSPLTSLNIAELCDNDSKHFPVFDREYFSCAQNRNQSDSCVTQSKGDESKEAPDNAVVLDQSCSTTIKDCHVYDYGCSSVKSINIYSEEKESAASFLKIYPSSDFSHSDVQIKNFKDEVTDTRKSKPISNPLFFGHILHEKQSNSSLRTKVADNFNESMLSTQNGASFLKKQNPSSSNTVGNTQPTQVKTKLRSFWNNMKYGWRVKREVNLKLDSATYLLGLCYHNKPNDDCIQDVTKEFKLDLLSKIWLTYRINFPPIPGTDFISDSGWGCMLRCGQMMMAQALVCHFLQRDWRISFDQPDEKKHFYRMILRWFGDALSDKCPFSLHHLVSLGISYGRKAGDWYGPTHAAQVLRDALIQAKRSHPQMKHLSMYVALDGIVFKEDVFDLCCKPSDSSECGLPEPSKMRNYRSSTPNMQFPHSSYDTTLVHQNSNSLRQNVNINTEKNYGHCEFNDSLKNNMSFIDMCPSYSEFGPPSFSTVESYWSSLILFVSVRLGNDKINPFYIPCLKSLLAYENCIGIIGGRPKHALYFIGWQDDKLIHMDPHSCQPVVDMDKDDFNEKSFHSSSIRTMSFNEMDPSCAIGFYFRKREEFQHFIDRFSEITAPMKRNLDYPIFALADGKRVDVEEVETHRGYARSSSSHNSKVDEDDYILL